MIENEMAKFEKPDHERLRSWLYPSLASCFSSSESSCSVDGLDALRASVAPSRSDPVARRLDPSGWVVQSSRVKWFELRPLTQLTPGSCTRLTRCRPRPSHRPDRGRCCARCAGTTPSRRCVEQLATAIRLGVYPRGTTLPPSASSPSGWRSPAPPCARRSPRCARPDSSRRRRGRGGGTVVTLKPPGSRRRAAPGRTAAAQRASWLRRAGLPPDRRAGRRGTRRRPRPRRAPREPRWRRRTTAVAGATDPAAHRQADSRFHLTVAAAHRVAR